MTEIEPRGASPLPPVHGNPGPARSEGASAPVGPEPVGPESVAPEAPGPQPVAPEPARSDPTGPGLVAPEPARSEPPDPESMDPGLAGLEPAGSEPAGLESMGLELDAGGLPPRSRGVIGLLEENCTVCMLCARECPDWCIYIESHKQTLPAPEGGRPRVRNVLDRFAIDFSLCMYCGICVEVCPYDALFWSPEFGYPETGIAGLTHERDRLRDWMWTVPPPPAHDPGAPLPREAQAAGPGAGPAVESG